MGGAMRELIQEKNDQVKQVVKDFVNGVLIRRPDESSLHRAVCMHAAREDRTIPRIIFYQNQ